MLGWHAESVVANFVIYLLILQSCDRARTQPEIGRRDGLAKFVPGQGTPYGSNGPPDTLHVFNFAKLCETLYAQLMHSPAPADQRYGRQGRALRKPQAQLLWVAERPVASSTAKPFNVLQQLQQELDEQLKLQQATTVKPFSVLEQLTMEQVKLLQQQRPNISFDLIQALQLEQEKQLNESSTVKPIDLFQQLDQELEKHDQPGTFEVIQPASTSEPMEQHKSGSKEPEESTRAKDSQKRKRKRIRRRRKRIRRRRKRKRRRGKKKRKKKRKKKQKKKHKKEKKKKKRKRRKPAEHELALGQQAQVIFANPTKHPYHYPHEHGQAQQPATTILQLVTTTKRPATTHAPFSKIKYLLRHNSLFKKKKKEWFNHVGHVLYPFIKFVAFFTVLNPFTLGVFLFTLISPVVFGFLGFVALSVIVKPFLSLIFGVKANVDIIDHRRYLANKRAEQLKLNLRPVTIHKHFYQQKPLHSTPPRQYRPVVDWRRQGAPPEMRPPQPMAHPNLQRHNPLLPAHRAALARPDFPFL